ncbi:N-acetylmuramoyl-L-alanine amidase [Streptomyces sp. H27-H5]|uniref:peptidoglycan recognition protein family protein n=1 Tax=Streptomyces sp. H27-H5 TaxID=2996460 RepID=UPI002271F67E|nr:N-acetylmuramoyl-L-alanine amidase [Streptomyces sp. H27-H5]MCY0963382.1 N-acetylmuramoyl-L-alanine amidase [Streptomyces sp. H27-H5]
MAWYPGATKMELQPESDSQPAIRPTQFILHSIAATWTKERTYEYWDQSTNLESHFGQSYDGSIAQYIGTETRADANYLANRRSDGTGAVSIETASNDDHSDPWTDAQVEGLIRLGVWLHQTHGIPLRVCRSASDPGFGYHRLHADWAVSGTACPGDKRVAQFKNIIFPSIVARANGQTAPTEEDMPLTAEDLDKVAKAVWSHTESGPPNSPIRTGAAMVWMDSVHAGQNAKLDGITTKLGTLQQVALTPEQITAIADKVASSPILADNIAKRVAADVAARMQS